MINISYDNVNFSIEKDIIQAVTYVDKSAWYYYVFDYAHR